MATVSGIFTEGMISSRITQSEVLHEAIHTTEKLFTKEQLNALADVVAFLRKHRQQRLHNAYVANIDHTERSGQ